MNNLIEDEENIVLEEQEQAENVEYEEDGETDGDVSFYLRPIKYLIFNLFC